MKKINLIVENVRWIKDVRMSEKGMYHEVLFNISILCWNIFCDGLR